MEESILLEADTNDLEILVFPLGDTPFGLNVAKVREIIQPCKTIAIPYAPHAVEGSFKIREKILTLVNLGRYFGMEGEQVRQGHNCRQQLRPVHSQSVHLTMFLSRNTPQSRDQTGNSVTECSEELRRSAGRRGDGKSVRPGAYRRS